MSCSSSADRQPPFLSAGDLCRQELKPLWRQIRQKASSQDLASLLPLLERLERASWEMWQKRLPRFEPENFQSFRRHAEKFHRRVQQALQVLRQAVKAQKTHEESSFLQKIQMSCADCHREYRFDWEE